MGEENDALPTVYRYNETEDGAVIVEEEYVDGANLSELLEVYRPDDSQTVAIVRRLCGALNLLHRKGFIHRDIKPENILVTSAGRVVLLDLDAASAQAPEKDRDTRLLGTVGYAAPEQFGGQGQTDARTDIYCLGATLYHLVTGKNPADPPYEMRPIREIDPTLSEGLEKIIWKCTRPDPAERYQSCAEVWYALEHYEELNQEFKKRQKLKLIIFSISLAAAMGFLAFGGILKMQVAALRESYYKKYIDDARIAENPEDRLTGYKEAIHMHPDAAEPWIKLMDQVYLADDEFSSAEDEEFRTLLISENEDGICYEDLLMNDPATAAEVSYKYGIAYFYDYEGVGNPGKALKWLDIAQKSSFLDENKAERARRLMNISEYYTEIGVKDRAGDVKASYRDYFDDLKAVASGNITAEDNPTTAVMVYRQTVGRIYDCASEFRDDGVTEEEMTELLQGIKDHINKDLSEINDRKVQDEVTELEDGIVLAEKSISNVYKE